MHSKLGEGTTFEVYLPQVEAEADAAGKGETAISLSRGGEAILLVEDEDAVREVVCRMLKQCGYTVLSASLPGEALALIERHRGPISLLVTDVVMPEMGGRELAERVVRSRPGIKVLYISGYADDAIAHRRIQEPGMMFLPKPFTSVFLSRKVREALDASSPEER